MRVRSTGRTIPVGAKHALITLIAIGSATVTAVSAEPTSKKVALRGEVLELSAILKPLGIGADSEPISKQVALRTAEGAVLPLLSEDSSRALFLDARLRNRPAEITALQYEGLPYLQVLTFRVKEGERYRIPEYYCIICTISVRYPQICPCCQGDMELRMQPERP